MPHFSAFSSFGQFRFANREPKARSIYRALVQGAGGDAGPGGATGKGVFDLSIGTYEEAKLYATARGLGDADGQCERAYNQSLPLKALEGLPGLEADYRVTPESGDTQPVRGMRVYVKQLLPGGAVMSNVYAALRGAVGAAFLAYYPVPYASSVATPANPASSTSVHSVDVQIPVRLVQLVDPVATIGAQTVEYENFDTTAGEVDLLLGDVVMVGAGNTAQGERVTVTAVAGAGTASRTFTATFTKSHDIGAPVTTGNWPLQTSSTRLAYVVLTPAGAVDAETRRKVNAVMSSLAREVSQWGIVAAVSPTGIGGTLGPLTVGAPAGTCTTTSQPYRVVG